MGPDEGTAANVEFWFEFAMFWGNDRLEDAVARAHAKAATP
jgi:hypothetical protein